MLIKMECLDLFSPSFSLSLQNIGSYQISHWYNYHERELGRELQLRPSLLSLLSSCVTSGKSLTLFKF